MSEQTNNGMPPVIEAADDEDTKPATVRVIIHSFFIVPFLIAVFGVLIFTMFKIVVGTPPNLEEALQTISRGSETERWQAAMDLTAMLQSEPELEITNDFAEQLVHEYERSAMERKPFLRTYLAMAMGLTRNSRFEEPLLRGLEDEDPASRLAAIKALGLAGGEAAEQALIALAGMAAPNITLECVIALGRIGRHSSLPLLRDMLQHPEPNVQWDAAIALAKMGDDSGAPLINQLLDREYYSQFPGVDEQEQDQAILVAIEVAVMMNEPMFKENLDKLSRNDPNLKIANAALGALQGKADHH